MSVMPQADFVVGAEDGQDQHHRALVAQPVVLHAVVHHVQHAPGDDGFLVVAESAGDVRERHLHRVAELRIVGIERAAGDELRANRTSGGRNGCRYAEGASKDDAPDDHGPESV
jgi:hypothetical protein